MQMICMNLIDELYLEKPIQVSRRKSLCELLKSLSSENRVLCLLPEVIRVPNDLVGLCLDVANNWKPSDLAYKEYEYSADIKEYKDNVLVNHEGFDSLSKSLRVHLTSGFKNDSGLTIFEIEGKTVFEFMTAVIHGNYDFYYFWIAPTESLINTVINDFHTSQQKIDLAKSYPFNDIRINSHACNGWNPEPGSCFYELTESVIFVTNQLQGLEFYMPKFEKGSGNIIALASTSLSDETFENIKNSHIALAADVLAVLKISGTP